MDDYVAESWRMAVEMACQTPELDDENSFTIRVPRFLILAIDEELRRLRAALGREPGAASTLPDAAIGLD